MDCRKLFTSVFDQFPHRKKSTEENERERKRERERGGEGDRDRAGGREGASTMVIITKAAHITPDKSYPN